MVREWSLKLPHLSSKSRDAAVFEVVASTQSHCMLGGDAGEGKDSWVGQRSDWASRLGRRFSRFEEFFSWEESERLLEGKKPTFQNTEAIKVLRTTNGLKLHARFWDT